ncbi:hypothetical protein ASPACDRAFT_59496 [Aspergillus aculeatus ATCC 16872]|uniref:Letm1 RBD domain-containing protein n=1 Tax=Aspergillus aculeatus (strain ATCC 16872 / CBS 172.66 / WB 5094) TaxID=690307 RepID=A0A1L9WWN3_ASPA1|nr:uncharacterized protein ASPACDRAFT_59496 [Aspergillus aculeatus ATCC 16872]OJK00641.1 hypothetical protein ASPACDRAFT_59496 [Aspergillus aculeatus ATCC 16872]
MPVSLRPPQARVLLRSRLPSTSLSSSSSSSITSLLRHQQQQHNKYHHHKYFSTTSATSSPSPSSESKTSSPQSLTSTVSHSLSTDINPPASTRPAELTLPSALGPSASPADKLKHYLAIGRAYLTFYKTGLKNVYHNHRAAVPLRRALALPAHLPTSAYLAVTQEALGASKGRANVSTKSTKTTAKDNNSNRPGVISRSSFQLLHRAAYDIRRMIPFTLLLIVCGEFTPLVVLALGNAVTPRTCRVPRQLEKERAKRVQRKKAALLLDRGTVTAPEVGSEKEMKSVRWLMGVSGDGDRDAVARACAVFGLARSHDRLAWPMLPVYRRRLERYLNYLEVDDELIRRGGGVQAMEAAEVRIAVEERGGVGVGSRGNGRNGWEVEREERRWLEKWLQWRG